MKRVLLLAIIMVLGISVLKAQTQIDEAKAKFIYNFTKFFDWPDSKSSGDFVIGVLGSDDLYDELSSYTKGKKVILQDIKVKRYNKPGQVSSCHILYVGEDLTDALPSVKDQTGSNTLVISDEEGGIEKGAALNFVLMGNRLKYEFAPSHAMDQGLKFSSRIRDMAAKSY